MLKIELCGQNFFNKKDFNRIGINNIISIFYTIQVFKTKVQIVPIKNNAVC